jgi:hypothetical protein
MLPSSTDSSHLNLTGHFFLIKISKKNHHFGKPFVSIYQIEKYTNSMTQQIPWEIQAFVPLTDMYKNVHSQALAAYAYNPSYLGG